MTDRLHPSRVRACADTESDALNQRCVCRVIDTTSLRETLEAALPATGLVDPQVHSSLFSGQALFIDRVALDAMTAVAASVFDAVASQGYIEHVLSWAPELARHDPGSVGGVLGLDFHLTVSGPRLIEINTNPGGLLLNALALDEVRSCAPATWVPWATSADARDSAIAAWLDDMRSQLGRTPERVAIVDDAPHEQYLHPEFALFTRAFRASGVSSVICSPQELALGSDGLRDGSGPIDAVYNRLTDFALAAPENEALGNAYRRGAIALSPHPRAHALFADKRNLAVLGDPALLERWGIDAAVAQRLTQAIPKTVVIGAENRDALWAERKKYFFKPATGYGSRGSYRGAKLTKRTWDDMASSSYVAQSFTPPGMRLAHGGISLKADVRCFASISGVLLFAGRLYQGQTTNMRTPGGGFAAVLTTPGSEERT